MSDLLEHVAASLDQDPIVHYYQTAFHHYPDLLLKDLIVEESGPDRSVKLSGRWVVSFGSDSFLGLDQDPRVKAAIRRGLDRWGSHNGCSRAFSSVASNAEAERKLAECSSARTL
jgi:glycine C-acetyltransferase